MGRRPGDVERLREVILYFEIRNKRNILFSVTALFKGINAVLFREPRAQRTLLNQPRRNNESEFDKYHFYSLNKNTISKLSL